MSEYAEEQSGLSRKWLIVIAILAALAVLAVYCQRWLSHAIWRSKAHRAYADIRVIADAVEKYRGDTGCYPKVDNIESLRPALQPTYIRLLPTQDIWRNRFRYHARKENPDAEGPDAYTIASAGLDRRWEKNDLWEYESSVTKKFDNDIVYRNGSFIRYMEGMGISGPP